jgi:hypothetical protein
MQWIWIIVAVVVLAAIGLALWMARRQRSTRLRQQFGPEYERAVAERGARRHGESELRERQRRRAQLAIRPLAPESRHRYVEGWRQTQARFVDSPGGAISEADRLVMDVMRERGYPVEDFEQRSADVSVDHPAVVDNYRAAHAISMANDHGKATTEDLRQAMVHYRALVVELLESEEPGQPARRVG